MKTSNVFPPTPIASLLGVKPVQKRERVLHLAVISDIHVGSRGFIPEKLVSNLDAAFPDNVVTGDLDLIVFAGDVFDALMESTNEALILFEIWFSKFLRMCKRRDILVYVLEGTRSHDRGQGQRLVHLNKELGEIGADLVYINTLTIRYEERFDMNFLFVPDDLHHDTSVTLGQVHELLKARNLSMVDFSFMHGNFPHQLPPVVRAPMHDPDAYQAITRYAIPIGHIHTSSLFGRIFAQGSFDRDKHGEEELKGHLRFQVYNDETFEVEFIVNEGAHIYRTVDVRTLSIEKAFENIRSTVHLLGEGVSIRILAEPEHPIFSAMIELIREFPLVNWSSKKDKKSAKERAREEIKRVENYQPTVINRENISGLLMDRLATKDPGSEIIDSAAGILKQLLAEAA